METEPFDEAVDLLAIPTSPAVSPPCRLKRLKKSSQIPAAAHPVGSPPPPSPPPPSHEETLAQIPSPPTNPSPLPPPPSDAEAPSPVPSPPLPKSSSSPLPPTDTAEEEDGLDPLFSETCAAATGWDPLGMPVQMEGYGEEEMLGGGLIEELRREKSAKKRLDMGEGEEGGEMAEVKGKRSKRRKKEEAPKESARGKKRSEKERRVQLDSIHAESQRLLRETRSASFKPTAQPVYKPISSVLEKIRLRKLEILKKSNIPNEEDDDGSSEPVSDSTGYLGVPQDDVDNEDGMNCSELKQCDSVPEKKELLDGSQDNLEDKAQSGDSPNNAADERQSSLASSPTKSTDDILSEDEDYNDKENIDPSTEKDDANIHEPHQRALAGDSCPDDAVLKDFLDVEAEEEDDSDDDMMRFKENEEDDGSDENEVFNDLIAAGYEEEEIDHEKRNALHQKWLQQQDAAETNKFMQKLKFGPKEQKKAMDQDEDDAEDCKEESENEMYDLTPTNVVRQNSEKAKQMIARMFTDDNDTYEHSDDEEIAEHLARQRISKREVQNSSFISPLEDDSSREVFSLIKKLNIAPQPKKRGKHVTSNHEMAMAGRDSSASSKSSFLGRTSSVSMASSHRSVYRTYVFGRDDSNSSSLVTSESNADMDQTNSNQPKKAKFSSSQPKQAATKNAEGDASSGVSLIEILRRSSATSDKHEFARQESCGIITESQAAHQFAAFKLSRRFSRVGARN
ncbi:hypothetical protein ABZP36_018137 [Zizania latifolia]